MKLPRAYVTKIVYAHNGLLGSVHLAEQSMRRIQTAATTTGGTKRLARRIEDDLFSLRQMLKVRIDHDYLIRRFQNGTK